jgi:hypothetical protein
VPSPLNHHVSLVRDDLRSTDRDQLRAAAVVLTSAAGASAHAGVVGCTAGPGKRMAVTRHYRVTLLIGSVENMYMHRQVRANHLKHGEVMLRGRMTGPDALTGGSIRHLEVQICARQTRAVVTTASPRIVVDDVTTHKLAVLPVSVIEGIGEGVADLHYGNNIAMAANHRFVVTVTWNGERASFRISH